MGLVEVVDSVVWVVLTVVGPMNGVVEVTVVGFVSDVVAVVIPVFCGTIVSLSCAVSAQPEALTEKYAFSQGFFAVMTSSEVSLSNFHSMKSAVVMMLADLTGLCVSGFKT